MREHGECDNVRTVCKKRHYGAKRHSLRSCWKLRLWALPTLFLSARNPNAAYYNILRWADQLNPLIDCLWWMGRKVR